MTVPLGKPLQLTDEQLDQAAEVTQDDIQRARALWKQAAPKEFKTLLEAVDVDIVEDSNA